MVMTQTELNPHAADFVPGALQPMKLASEGALRPACKGAGETEPVKLAIEPSGETAAKLSFQLPPGLDLGPPPGLAEPRSDVFSGPPGVLLPKGLCSCEGPPGVLVAPLGMLEESLSGPPGVLTTPPGVLAPPGMLADVPPGAWESKTLPPGMWDLSPLSSCSTAPGLWSAGPPGTFRPSSSSTESSEASELEEA